MVTVAEKNSPRDTNVAQVYLVPGLDGAAYDASVQDWFSRVEAAGGSFDLTGTVAEYTEAYSKNVWNTAIKALKGQNTSLNPTSLDLWSKAIELYAFAGVSNLAGARIKIKSWDGSDLTGGTGFIPAGPEAGAYGAITSTLQRDYANAIYAWVYVSKPHTFGTGRSILRMGTLQYPGIIANGPGDGLTYGRYSSTTVVFYPLDTGLMMLNTYDLWQNGIKIGTQSGGSTNIDAGTTILMQSSNCGVGLAGVGLQMTDTEVEVFHDIINYIATNFGFNTY